MRQHRGTIFLQSIHRMETMGPMTKIDQTDLLELARVVVTIREVRAQGA